MLRQYILLESLLRSGHQKLVHRHEERGATAVEYGLMVALIAVAIIAAVTLLGSNIRDMFSNVSTEIGKGKASTPAGG